MGIWAQYLARSASALAYCGVVNATYEYYTLIRKLRKGLFDFHLFIMQYTTS